MEEEEHPQPAERPPPREEASIVADVSEQHTKVFDYLNIVLDQRLGKLILPVWINFASVETPQVYEPQNICQLMADYTNVPARIYFCSQTYPNSEAGKASLLDALRLAAHHGEDKLISGSEKSNKRKREKHEYVLICQRGRNYSGNKFDSETNEIVHRPDYLEAAISNPRSKCRHGPAGRSGSRRTSTSMCLGPDQPKCPFNVSLYKDALGFYIKTGIGNPFHQYHPPRQMNLPTKLLKDDARQLLQDMNSGRAATGVAASVHYARSQREGMPSLLSHHQIRYIMKRSDEKSTDKGGENEPPTLDTSISGLYKHMEAEGYQYVTLIDKHVGRSLHNLVNETKLGMKLIKQTPLRDTQSPALSLEAARVAAQHRSARKIPPAQDMMVALTYSSPLELRQFTPR